MALTRTAFGPYLHDNTGFVAQGTGPFTTGAFTPPNNSLLGVWVLCGAPDVANIGDEYIVSGGGLTWVRVLNRFIAHGDGGGFLLQFWMAAVGVAASMQVVVTHTGRNSYAFGVFPYAWEGYDTGSSIGGVADADEIDTANALALSSAPATDSDVIAALIVASGTETPTPPTTGVTITSGSGFVEVADVTSTQSFTRWQTQARTGSVSDAVSWTTATDAAGGFARRLFGAVEVKAAAPPPPQPSEPLSSAGSGGRRRRYPYPNVIDDGWDWEERLGPPRKPVEATDEPEPEPAPEPAPESPEPVPEPRKPVGLSRVAEVEPKPVQSVQAPPAPPANAMEVRLADLEARIAALEARHAPEDEDDEERLIMRWFLDS